MGRIKGASHDRRSFLDKLPHSSLARRVDTRLPPVWTRYAGAVMIVAHPDVPLKHTPLHRLHVELGARMVPFAGYQMPVQYANGILKEHLHVRGTAGVFDVSRMGQFDIQACSGRIEDTAK